MTVVSECPEVNPNGRYNVAQTAQLLGIHRNTLKKYTEEGRIRMMVGKATGKKYYLGSDIIRFWERYY